MLPGRVGGFCPEERGAGRAADLWGSVVIPGCAKGAGAADGSAWDGGRPGRANGGAIIGRAPWGGKIGGGAGGGPTGRGKVGRFGCGN